MKRNIKNDGRGVNAYFRFVVLISAAALAASCLMFILFGVTRNKTVGLFAIIGLLPFAVNLILLLPRTRGKKSAGKKEPALKRTISKPGLKTEKVRGAAKEPGHNAFVIKAGNFYFRFRTVLVSILVILAVALVNALFWFMFLKTGLIKTVPSYFPVIAAAFFILYVVLEKLCKHLIENHEEEKKKDKARIDSNNAAKNDGKDFAAGMNGAESLKNGGVSSGTGGLLDYSYETAVLSSLRGGLIVLTVTSVGVFAATFLNTSGNLNILRYVNIAMGILEGYVSVFIVLSLIARLVKKEMRTSPELTVPIPGIGGRSMGIIAYLENNTGITMRSLWSIKLIKKILPIACVLVFLIMWLFSGVVQIEAAQQGAHYRFGKLQDGILRPGLHFTLPYGIDEVKIYDTAAVNRMTIGYDSDKAEDNLWTTEHSGGEYKLLLGGGTELVSVNLLVEYRIKNLKDYVTGATAPEAILKNCAYEEITDRIIDSNIDTLLFSEDRAELSRLIAEGVKKRIEKYRTGLEVVDIDLESIHPPVDIAWVYEGVIGIGIKAKEIILSAEAKAVLQVSDATIKSSRTVTEAKKYQFSSPAEAKSKVAEFLACIDADDTYGEQYRYDKYLRALVDAYNSRKLIILGDGVDADNIYIVEVNSGTPVNK